MVLNLISVPKAVQKHWEATSLPIPYTAAAVDFGPDHL